MTGFDPDFCPVGALHDWQPDPERRGEGLACADCGLTEAELAGDGGEGSQS